MKYLPLVLLVAACATAPHESLLSAVESKCQLYPADPHCTQDLPQLRALVVQERADAAAQNNATAAVGIAALLGIAAAALEANDPQPTYVVVPAYGRWR